MSVRLRTADAATDRPPAFSRFRELGPSETIDLVRYEPGRYRFVVETRSGDERVETIEPGRFDCNASRTTVTVGPHDVTARTISTAMACGTDG